MTRRPTMCALAALLATILAEIGTGSAAYAQQGTKKKDKISSDTTPYKPTLLFNSAQPLELSLTTNLKQIKKDRGETPPWRPATLAYKGADGATVEIPARVRTRGIWRKKNCDIPPLGLNFVKDKVKQTVFVGQDHLKLTVPCRDNERYEQYVLQEMMLYRIYNLLTPLSHRVRTVRLSLVDSATGKPEMARYGFLMESEIETAKRNGGRQYDVQGATSSELDPATAAIVGLFQYLIANTDYSLFALHNMEMVQRDTSVFPVAYDFDFSGAVNTPYATVDPRIPVRRVTDRIFRGPCAPAQHFATAIALFNARRDSIKALYDDDLGRLIDRGTAKSTIDFFGEFYRRINDQNSVKREILEACTNGHLR
jgi:hypothetical protein